MDEHIFELLKNSRIFSSLSDDARLRLFPKFSEIELNRAEALFYQGDPSESVFLLISGKLSAELISATGETRIIGHIEPGESVGELGALSAEPRSLTVKALKNSRLLRLSAADFVEICHQFPAIMFAAIHPIISRSKHIIQVLSIEKSNKHIVLAPANKEVNLEKFTEKLLPLVENLHSLIVISNYHADFNGDDPAPIKEKVQAIIHAKKSSHKILYILSTHDTALAKIAFKKADMVYVVGESRGKPKIDRHVLDKIESQRLHLRTDPELILLHPENTLIPKNTADWLTQAPFGLHHHIRIDKTKDFHRILRFIRGKATGLVLSGGGTRGWAHLGAIKALHDAKIPIDMIGGTSVGAIVGACYAMNESYEEAYEKFYKIVVKSDHSISWRSLTWPAISLFDARSFTESQIEAFGKLQIEDLWLPYFCLSCNLATSMEEVHRSGTLWKKTRASSALPGIIPPMLIEGELHLDGGLLNNLPVDIMRQYIGNRGKIIAVDLNSFTPDRRIYNFPPILTFKKTLLAKLGKGLEKYKFPRFVDTFLRGIFVGSLAKAKQNSLEANIFISLNLSKFRLLHSNPKQADRIIEIAYQESLKKIYEEKNRDESHSGNVENEKKFIS